MLPETSWVTEAVLRMSPVFELVAYDRLTNDERGSLESLSSDPDFYGIVRPVGPATNATIKAVGRDTALLLLTLDQPGPLPTYIRQNSNAPQRLAEIADLVLDGVLEVLYNGAYGSGPDATKIFGAVKKTKSQHPLAQLSRAAMRYAAELGLNDLDELAGRLYGYNSKPLGARWRQRWPDTNAVTRALGIAEGRRSSQHLQDRWRVPTDTSGWLGWERNDLETSDMTGTQSPSSYKLYLSPTPDAIESAFQVLLDILPTTRAHYFKIGPDAAGLLRADKMIAYFGDLDSLLDAATKLEPALDGIPAQGVPFTAPIDAAGLLSWGMDPPASEKVLPWQERESWRLWLVRRLAAALITSRQYGDTDLPIWRFALERVRRLGVDVDRWIPSPTIWQKDSRHGC